MRAAGGIIDNWAQSVLPRRRFWAAAVALLLAGLLLSGLAFSQQRPRLIVYLHSSIKSRALETALATRMPSVEVVVYGRYRDFARELAKQPDAAMALAPVLAEHGLSLDLRGVRGGQDTESYVLLSIGSTLDKSQFSKLTVGAVDLLGRERTARFVAELLNVSTPPEIKYVIKSDDLLPLLQFQSANAVILSEDEAKRITALSKLDLRVTPLGARVGLAAVSFRTDAGRRLIKPGIQNLDADANRKIGVDAWR
jgi:hypothetical protein